MEFQLLTPSVPIDKDATLVDKVFANRGVFPFDIYHYLHTTKGDILEPELLDNIDAGAKMFIKHLAAGDKIFVQVDSDVDGYTSAAALINYANMIAPGHAQQNISYRIHDGKEHGIILDTIPEDVKLVIVPDAGSNDYEQHKALYDKGVDVLVIDHHEADRVSQYACIINNQLSKKYSNKSLSGVGMVYKFCQYIDKFLNKNYADELLDLVAIGMVADMMDLRNFETKELVNLGANLRRNPFLVNFIEAQNYSLKGKVTPFGISFYIAPFINATIRVGSLDEKLLLFESMLDFRAYEQIASTKRGCKGQLETRVEQACRNCKNIKNRQTKARDTSLEIIDEIIERDNLLSHPILIIKLDNPVDEHLTGLIANQVMGQYMRPVILLNQCIDVDEETGEVTKIAWRGSGRNATYSNLVNFREFLANSGLVEYAQGHASAFGVGILDENLEAFTKYIDEELKDFSFSNCYYVDFCWVGSEVNLHAKDVFEIGKLADNWGQGLAEPKIAIQNLQIESSRISLLSPDKSPTLKITLSNDLTLIKFRSSQEEYDNLYSETGCVTLNAVGTCNLNEWQGKLSPQIVIEDYEIVSKSSYYF